MNRRTPIVWALWSRRNLTIAAALTLLVIIMFASCRPAGEPSPVAEPTPIGDRTWSRPPGLEAPAPQVAPEPVEPFTGTEGPSLADPLIEITAEAFTTEWVDIADPVWPANTVPYATKPLVDLLGLTDKTLIPVVTQPIDSEVTTRGAGYAEVIVALDEEQTVTVILTETADGWKAAQILP